MPDLKVKVVFSFLVEASFFHIAFLMRFSLNKINSKSALLLFIFTVAIKLKCTRNLMYAYFYAFE